MKSSKRLFFIVFGTILMTLGAHFFNFPSNIAAGGVGGIAQALNKLFPILDRSIVISILNLILFILGFILIGKEFGINTFIGTIAYSLSILLLEKFFPLDAPLVHDRIINLILGSIFIGVGFGLVISQNASTGGSDVIAKTLEKYFRINISKAVLITDASIILFATIAFGIESGIYSILSITLTSIILDKVLSGFNTKYSLTIISRNNLDINKYINTILDRGTTIYRARGGYTNEEKDVIVTIVDRRQYIKIRDYVNKLDPDAFLLVSHASEVIGEGFTKGV